jgi:hypothetical protein
MNESPLPESCRWQVDLSPDHLQHIARCHPLLGVAELVWNALDADADDVRIWLQDGPLGGVDRIQVIDNGSGIDITRVETAFKTLGQSWKRGKKTTETGRSLHGQHGRGRFRACALGRICAWDTTNQAPTKDIYRYSVTINADRLKDVDVTEAAVVAAGTATGTNFTVTELRAPQSRMFVEDNVRDYLTEHFGHYLLNYPKVKISINGGPVNPDSLIAHKETVDVPAVPLADGTTTSATIRIIEWKKPGDRKIFLCDADGMTFAEVPMRSRLNDDTVSAYVASPYLVTANVSDVADGQIDQLEEAKPILAVVRDKVKEYLLARQADKAKESVARWKSMAIYPYATEPSGAVEHAQRTVFNMVADQVERHLPHFGKAAPSVKRMHFSLLRHAVESQPEGLAEIIEGYTNIPVAERQRIVSVIEQTSLDKIFRGVKLVQDRLAVLTGLEELLNNPALKKQFTERKQLHEIVSRNVWIFGDAFSLTASDETLSTSVRRHVAMLKAPIDVDPDFRVLDGRKRVDLMLTRKSGVPGRTLEHLVVELKRPSEKGGAKILSQMNGYAFALAEDPQWKHVVRWTFWGVVHELDGYGNKKANVKDRAPGLADEFANATIWLKTWSEVIADARGRLEFLRSSFDVETTRQQALEHLADKYSDASPKAIRRKRSRAAALKRPGITKPLRGRA